MDQLTICIIIFILTLVSYVLNKMPMSITALGGLALLGITGTAETTTLLGGFSNINTIIMGTMFVIASGLSKTSFVDKLSNGITRLAKGSFKKAYLCYIILAAIITSFMASPMISFAIVFPLATNMCKTFDVSPSKIMFALMVVCLGCCCILPFGPAITQAVNMNGFLQIYGFDLTISAIDFTIGRLPLFILIILWAYFIAPKMAPDQPIIPIATDQGRKMGEKQKLSKFPDAMGVIIFFATIILLIFGGNIIEPWLVCLIGALLVVICGVMNEREMIASIPFSMIFLYVGALGMGNALNETGAGHVIGNFISSMVGGTTNSYVLGALFFLVTFILTQFMLNQAVMNILVPICLMTSQAMGANPIGLLIIIISASLTAFALPMSTPAIPVAMGAGGYDVKSMIKQSGLISLMLGVGYVAYTMTMYPAF